MSTSSIVALTGKKPNPGQLYYRVGYNDHVVLNQLLAARKLHANGFILDARCHSRHESFREQAMEADIATCLDTQAMELAMPGARSKGHAELPWAQIGRGAPESFSSKKIEMLIQAIVARSIEGRYTQVMAPAHYIQDVSSGWIPVDGALTSELRGALDAADQEATQIVYPLAVHGRLLYELATRSMLKRHLRSVPIDLVTLRIQPFGYSSGPQVLRKVLEACLDLREIDRPIMIERAGFAGLVLFAFSAVDVVTSSIMTGDAFDIGRLQTPPEPERKASFGPSRAVYIEALGTAVGLDVAARLMATSQGKFNFACRDQGCCPNGAKDMLTHPERHSALARQRQYTGLQKVPASMRAEHFIHNLLTPVCDQLTRAMDVEEVFKKVHRRMLAVKEMLMDLQREQMKAVRRSVAGHRAVPPGSTAQIIPLAPRDPRGR